MSNNKKKRSPIGVLLFVVILMFAGVGGAYYYFVVYDTQPKESYAIQEKDSDVQTQTIIPNGGMGVVSGRVDVGGGKSDKEGFFPDNPKDDSMVKYAFAAMEDSDAQFFVNTCIKNGEDLTAVSKSGFIEQTEVDPDEVTASIGKVTKEFLIKHGHSSDSEYLKELTFDGETPEDYYESRNLDISCDKLVGQKIYATTASVYLIIYDAEITTNHCDGKSVFPKEGKTKNRRIGVMASDLGVGTSDVVLMHVIFL